MTFAAIMIALICFASVVMSQESEFVEARRLALSGEDQEYNPGLFLPLAAYDVALSGKHVREAGTENGMKVAETYDMIFSLFSRPDSLEDLIIEKEHISEYVAFVSGQIGSKRCSAQRPYILLTRDNAGKVVVAHICLAKDVSLNSFNEEIWDNYPGHAGSAFYVESPNPNDWNIYYQSLEDHVGPVGYYPTLIIPNSKDLPSDVYTIVR